MPSKKCTKCGRVHKAHQGDRPCGGHLSHRHPTDPDGPCTKPAMHGQNVCGKHGGKAPQNVAAAERRLAEERAARAVARFGGRSDVTPTEALLETVQWTAGFVAWLRDRVNDTEDDSLVWGVSRDKTGGQDWGKTYEAGANVWMKLLGEWSDRLVKVCAAAISAGIEERRVRMAEAQGALVADVIKAILGDLKLTPAQQSKVGEIVPRHLRLLAG